MDRWLGAPGAAEDAAKFRQEYNGCLAEAAKADSQFAKQQWLIFADEWLKLALVAEEQQREEPEQPLAWM
jgi:hypothetical protein